MTNALRNPAEFYREGGYEPNVDVSPIMNLAANEYRKLKAERNGAKLSVLDVGSGANAVLAQLIDKDDDYTACDIVESVSIPVRYVSADLNNDVLSDKFADEKFDVVFCLEIAEHLFSPDALLRDLHSVLKPGGVLILSTPNLAYWMNRLLLLVGISPLLLENSSEVKLGRKFGFLGQGNRTEGHIRLFTYTAMIELLERSGFEVMRARGCEVWSGFLPDRILGRLSPRIAPDVAYIARSTS